MTSVRATSSLSPSISVSAILIALCLMQCQHELSCSAFSLSDEGTFQQQHQQQPQQQLQAQHSVQKQSQPSSDELVGQLLGLSSGASVSVRDDDSSNEAQLKALLSGAAKKKAQQQQQKPSKYDEERRNKLALKKKWHKLVDDLIDSSGVDSGQSLDRSSDNGAKDKSQLNKITVNQPIMRKRQPQASGSQSYDEQQQQSDAANQEPGKLTMILVKRKPTISDDIYGQLQQAQHSNSLSLPSSSMDQQSQQARQPAVSAGDQTRRILDDKFGILRESIFTTNNHLGMKGVPKFGSDEQF